MKRALPLLALLSMGCAAPFGVRVTFDEEADALASTQVEVTLVASCAADPAAEPVSPVARASATRGESMALPSVPPGRYGLVGRAWGADCNVVAAGCVDVDLSGSPRTLTVALHHVGAPRCVAASLCTSATGACTGPDAGPDGGTDGGLPRDTGPLDAAPFDGGELDAGIPDTGSVDVGVRDVGTDAGPLCPPLAARTLMEVTTDVTADTTWDCAHLWSLHTEINVLNASTSTITTLTIEPGTVVVAGRDGTGHVGALLVARTGRLIAEGTPTLPITFTSDQPIGTRQAGDWGGIALAGRASATSASSASALPSATYPSGRYGPFSGTPAEDDWDCGHLAYVRIAFSGAPVSMSTLGLAGLTMGACGTGTRIDHVQTHRGRDDGLTIYGGTVDLSHVLVSAAQEDSLDWNDGWRGRVQFFLAWQWPVSAGADAAPTHGIEADTELLAGVPRMPASHPTFFNTTFACASDVTDPCILLRTGTEGFFGNTIVSQADPTDDTLMICDDLTGAQATSGVLDLDESVLSDRFGVGAVTSCTTTFDDRAWACGRAMCDAALSLTFDYAAPVFDPGATLRGRCGAVPTDPADGRPPFFDAGATYCGAMGTTDWTRGWIDLAVD